MSSICEISISEYPPNAQIHELRGAFVEYAARCLGIAGGGDAVG